MATFSGIIFNEIQMPDFVRVTSIEHSILPVVSQTTLSVGGKAGAYDYGNVVGTREIAVNISIVAPEENVLPQLLEQLSNWLYYTEAKELILGDNPNRYYLAKFTGDSTFKESFLVGEGTITFLCTDPYIYGFEREYLIPADYAGDELQLTNTGNAETFPKMSFEITKDVYNFTVVSGEEYVDLGTPFSVDDTANLVDEGGYVIKDYLKSLNGWSVAPSVRGGTITGSMEVFGNVEFRQTGLDYSTGSGWHGASVIKPLSQEVTDFETEHYFRINTDATSRYIGTVTLKTDLNMRTGGSTRYKSKGMAKKGQTYNVLSKASTGWYKLENGYYISGYHAYSTFTKETYKADKMGKAMYILADSASNPVMVATVSDSNAKARSLVAQVDLVYGSTVKTIVKLSVPSKYNDLDGYWKIKRRKKVWYVELYVEIDDDKYRRILSKKYADSKGTFNRKVSKAQVAVQAYSTNPACYMALKDVRVKTLDNISNNSNKVPLILRAGDVLEIDNETGAILKNGIPFYQYLNPSSSFIKLQSGENGLIVSPYDAFTNGSISYTERTL